MLQRGERRRAGATRPTPRPRRCATREYYRYDIDVAEVAEVWRRGQRREHRWLLDLTAAALRDDPDLRLQRPGVGLGRGPLDGAGRGRRGRARRTCSPPRCSTGSSPAGEADFADKVLSAMRSSSAGTREQADLRPARER